MELNLSNYFFIVDSYLDQIFLCDKFLENIKFQELTKPSKEFLYSQLYKMF